MINLNCIKSTLFVFIFFIVSPLLAQGSFLKKEDSLFLSSGLKYSELVYLSEENKFLFSLNNTLYKSLDRGENWDIWNVWGPHENIIGFVSIEKKVFVTTSRGVYFNTREEWKKLWGISSGEIQTFLYDPEKKYDFYLGTNQGLKQYSLSEHKTYSLAQGNKYNVKDILHHKGYLIFSTESEIYKSLDLGKTWVKFFKKTISEGQKSLEEGIKKINARKIVLVIYKGKLLAWAKDELIYFDRLRFFSSFSRRGLPEEIAIYKFFAQESLLALTDRGLFIFREDLRRWDPYRNKFMETKVLAACWYSEQFIAVVTDKGLFVRDSFLDESLRSGMGSYEHEPSIQEVQEKAISYNQVSNEKLESWKKLMYQRAWFPDVSFNYSKRLDETYEIYTSSKISYSVDGPSDRTSTWAIRLSWKLGDILFNSDEFSMDTRSKLMVQLREDILEQVTRFYFERRRFQMELNYKDDLKWKRDRLLKIQELTAYLDAYTGGWFSKQMH